MEQANFAFAKKLVQAINPLPIWGPKTWVLVSGGTATASSKLLAKSANVHNMQAGLPNAAKGDLCVWITPSNAKDYVAAAGLAAKGVTVVLVNGLFKDPRSVSAAATMAYFYKPLTYNSAVVGCLLRVYPGTWAVVDAVTNQQLAVYNDTNILVSGTNTPDLRSSGKLVQKAVDQRAIRARSTQ